MVIEGHTIGREPIHVRRLHIRVAVAAHRIGALVVSHQIDDIGLLRGKTRHSGKPRQTDDYPSNDSVLGIFHSLFLFLFLIHRIFRFGNPRQVLPIPRVIQLRLTEGRAPVQNNRRRCRLQS